MLHYFRAETFRLAHKKSLYIYFAALAVVYLLVAYIRSGGFSAESTSSDALNLFGFLPLLAGGFLFAAIYVDDLNSKNLVSLVGFGLSRVKILIVKLLLMILCGALVFALVPLFHCLVYALLGWPALANTWLMVYLIALKYLLMTIAFSALAAVVVYGTQRATFAFVLFILLALGVISGLLSTFFNTFAPPLNNFLMSGISDRIVTGILDGSLTFLPVCQYVIYVGIAVVLSALAFKKKELEF